MALNLRNPPLLKSKFDAYPYQLDAFRAVKDLPYAAIFHEQGLGKTKIAIDIVLHWLNKDIVDTIFIIAKKSLVQNWVDEICSHSHITPSVLSEKKGSNNIKLNSPVILYIMNYEVIPSNLELISLFLETCRVGVILDESQKIKNPDSKLTKSFFEISKKFNKKIIMTGTPIANRPYDIWSQIYFLDSGKSLKLSFSEFKSKTDLPKQNSNNSWYFINFLAKIWQLIRPFSVRETKESSGIDLPSKSIYSRMVNLENKQAKIYANYRNQLMHELIDVDGKPVIDDTEYILKQLLRLTQCASNPAILDHSYKDHPAKFKLLQELLSDIISNKQKVIIWTSFIANVEWLADHLKEYNPIKIHGSITIDRRNISINKFKKDPNCKIMIATPGAAKEGLTLTIANHAIFYDRGFSLDDYLQAQDRIHRISQTQECRVINLIAINTIDEWVDKLLSAKYQASRLAQGDITKDYFTNNFEFNLSRILQEILTPQKT